MLPENIEVQDANDVVFVVFISSLEILKQSELNARLILESLLIANHLDCHHLLVLMIKALEGLPKTARPKFI